MGNFNELVDPFYGNGQTDFPPKSGLAATWFFPKAQTGNTHPGACLPFGMVSVCPYSGAYVTGYGLNGPNSHATPPRVFDTLTATGFTHFHPSGTGAVGRYYNYFRVVPLPGASSGFGRRYSLENEVASPGYYGADLRECGVRAELTVGARGAMHRYTPPRESPFRLAVDFSTGGLAMPDRRSRPSAASVSIGRGGFFGHVVMEGIPIFVAGALRGSGSRLRLFVGGEELSGSEVSFGGERMPEEPFGVVLEPGSSGSPVCELVVAFSLRGEERARAHLQELMGISFDDVRADAARAWNDRLGAIEIDAPSDAQSLFYSNLYHSLVKPADLAGESPFYETPSDFFTDFATLWDQYKTTLPLVLTLYPEVGAGIVNSLVATAEYVGQFTTASLLSRDFLAFENQARALAHHVIADARTRRIDGIDWEAALGAMVGDLEKDSNADFHETGIAHPFTHTLDLACGAFCTALVAHDMGEMATRDRQWARAGNWRNVYDSETGILGESNYYEGGPWNYSFRLLPDMGSRIALHGGDDPFVRDLERFFGYGADPVIQPTDPADMEFMRRGIALNRFEGFNNEPDIETPYAFVYAGRHDRTCEVVRAGMAHQFRAGRGGLPGNNDSGGLTATYVWNALGLFPVAGQPHVLIGSPLFPEACLHLPESKLAIIARDVSDESSYVAGASLNGRPLDRAWLSMKELLQGGELVLDMSEEPCDWGRDARPPSYRTLGDLSGGLF